MTKDKAWIYWSLMLYAAFGIFAYFYLDIPVASFFRVYEDSFFEDFFTTLSIAGESHWFIAGGFVVYLIYRKKNEIYAKRALFLFFSVGLSGIISGIIKGTAGRYRPVKFFKENLYGFDGWHFNEYKFNSFPSGHTTTAFAVGVALAIMFPKYKVYFILFGFFIAFTRISTTVHYLSDTIAGAFIGSVVAVFLYKKYFKGIDCSKK